MQIEAICRSVQYGNGVRLPEYLIRVSHKEAAQLGACHFTPGEILSFLHAVNALEDARRTIDYSLRNIASEVEGAKHA